MIRKLGRLNAAPEVTLAMFRDLARWPEWLPSIVSTRVVESSDERCLADVDQVILGRTYRQKIELRFRPQGYLERQVAGRLRSYEAEWRFSPARGGGTLVSAGIRLDLGLLGLFVSRRRVQKTIDRTFEETLQGARKQLRSIAASTAAPAGKPDRDPETTIEVFETPSGLEIRIGDRRYLAPHAD